MKFIFCAGPIYTFVADKASKSCAMDRLAEGFEFRAVTLGNQLHPAVRKITDGAGDIKTGGDGFRGITKTDALHLA